MNRKNTIYYKIAHYVCNKYSTDDDTKYVAMFLDMMAFQIFEISLLCLIGYLFGILTEVALVITFFIMARVNHKGIHARNRFRCIWYTLFSILSIASISSYIGILSSPLFGYLFGVVMRDRNNTSR